MTRPDGMTNEQATAILGLAKKYKVNIHLMHFIKRDDLPEEYFAGQVGPIYIGVCSKGIISS